MFYNNNEYFLRIHPQKQMYLTGLSYYLSNYMQKIISVHKIRNEQREHGCIIINKQLFKHKMSILRNFPVVVISGLYDLKHKLTFIS